MKRKTMTLVLCLLAALALVSVGFASWVISAEAKHTVEGSITVDAVVDKRLTVNHEFTGTGDTKDKFLFGKKSVTPAPQYSWLQNAETQEKLSVEIKFTVVKDASYELGEGKLFEGTVSWTSDLFGKKYNNQDNQEFIRKITPDNTKLTFDKDSSDPTGNTFTATLTLTLDWGAAFSNTNPYQYYNAHKATDTIPEGSITYVEDAKLKLQAFYQAVAAPKFNVTIIIAEK